MPFSVGQIVELFDQIYFDRVPDDYAGLRVGDRGTVVSSSQRYDFGGLGQHMASWILWHKDQRRSLLIDAGLRVYVNPMDRPGRVTGAFQTFQALSTVIQHEESHAIQEMRRDVERARMTAEDLRGHAWSQEHQKKWRCVAREHARDKLALRGTMLEVGAVLQAAKDEVIEDICKTPGTIAAMREAGIEPEVEAQFSRGEEVLLRKTFDMLMDATAILNPDSDSEADSE